MAVGAAAFDNAVEDVPAGAVTERGLLEYVSTPFSTTTWLAVALDESVLGGGAVEIGTASECLPFSHG